MVFNHLLDSGPKTRENVGSCWTERGEYGPLKRSTDSSPNLHLNITENTMRFGSHLKKKQHWLKVNNCRAGWDHSQSFSHSCLCLICISYTHQCAKNYFRATQLPGRSDFIFTCGISMYLHPSGFYGKMLLMFWYKALRENLEWMPMLWSPNPTCTCFVRWQDS